jgi:hypothetical protein
MLVHREIDETRTHQRATIKVAVTSITIVDTLSVIVLGKANSLVVSDFPSNCSLFAFEQPNIPSKRIWQ